MSKIETLLDTKIQEQTPKKDQQKIQKIVDDAVQQLDSNNKTTLLVQEFHCRCIKHLSALFVRSCYLSQVIV